MAKMAKSENVIGGVMAKKKQRQRNIGMAASWHQRRKYGVISENEMRLAKLAAITLASSANSEMASISNNGERNSGNGISIEMAKMAAIIISGITTLQRRRRQQLSLAKAGVWRRQWLAWRKHQNRVIGSNGVAQ
jgi:hypothetical protein